MISEPNDTKNDLKLLVAHIAYPQRPGPNMSEKFNCSERPQTDHEHYVQDQKYLICVPLSQRFSSVSLCYGSFSTNWNFVSQT